MDHNDGVRMKPGVCDLQRDGERWTGTYMLGECPQSVTFRIERGDIVLLDCPDWLRKTIHEGLTKQVLEAPAVAYTTKDS
jgi:hypothetical protein